MGDDGGRAFSFSCSLGAVSLVFEEELSALFSGAASLSFSFCWVLVGLGVGDEDFWAGWRGGSSMS